MGKLRNLSSDEILVQFFYALKIIRLSQQQQLDSNDDDDDTISHANLPLPEITNVVFMGMGEPSDNAVNVRNALQILTNVDLFHMGQTKVTVSTVAPTPQAFMKFADAPCVLAWSVHAANDVLRKKLVPTMNKFTTMDLARGLIEALLTRPKRLRATMLEIALVSGLNDTIEAAEEMAVLTQFIKDSVPGAKVMVNLIPFNDIGHDTYRTPSKDDVKAFQNVLWERGIYAHVRTTRGDDENAACGQLATKKLKKNSKLMP